MGANATPWFTQGAVAYLEQHVKPEWNVFEWGSGCSTVWLALRVHHVTTIEHQLDWITKVRADLVDIDAARQWPVTMVHYPVDDENYWKCIETAHFVPDCVLVDGRNRVKCMAHAAPVLKPGGLLVLDNADRPDYSAGCALLAGWELHEFGEPNGSWGTGGIWKTNVWIKPLETPTA